MTEQQQDTSAETQQEATPTIPKYRFDEESQKRKAAETRLAEIERERTEAEEVSAQQQGEYQKLAEKRKTQLEQRDARIKELEAQIVADARRRAFVSASQGIILPEALDDAFSMISEDEFADPEDETAYARIAEGLADKKPYLADSVRGSGSGGSSRPVLTGSSRREQGMTPSGRRRAQFPFNEKRSKPPFK